MNQDDRDRSARGGIDEGLSITDSRRQVTILFVDVADSTALFAGLDPEDVSDLLHELLQAVASIVAKHEGTIDKFLGDGLMAKFGAPLAVEDAATRALRAALEIRENAGAAVAATRQRLGWKDPVRVHIGLDTGLVAMSRIVTDDTVMGERVVGAARVMARSAGDEILVGESTMLASRDEFVFERVADVAMAKSGDRHGKVRCYRLVAAKAPAEGEGVLGTHRPAGEAIVGRMPERARVQAFVDAARSGAPGLMLVSGDPGQGKTRLLLHLRSCIDQALDLLVESCREEERYAQHAPLARLLARVIEKDPARVQALPAGHRQAVERLAGRSAQDEDEPLMEGTIRAALADLLREKGRERPVVVVLDDAHWCDDATMAALFGALAELDDDARVSLAVACRPEARDRITAAASRCASTTRVLEQIALEGLALGDAVDLIGRTCLLRLTPAAARRVAQIADGNPFCIEEIVLTLNARSAELSSHEPLGPPDIEAIQIPVRVEDIVMSRVAALDASTREVLEAASVIGEHFPLAALESVVGSPSTVASALSRLEEGEFVRLEAGEGSASGRFCHSYRRAAVYQSIPKRRLATLHLATARALRASVGEDIRPLAALLAHHYAAAGAETEAEEALLVAGTWAVHSAAGAEGQRHLERARQLYLRRVGDAADRGHLRMLEKNLGLARLLSGDLVGSVENFDAALRLLGMVIPEGRRRRALFGLRDALGAISHIRFGVRRKPWLPAELQGELFEILYNRCRAQNPTDAERSAFDNFAAIRQLTYLDPRNVTGAASLYASAGAFFAFAGLEIGDLPARAVARARAILDPEDAGERFEVDSMAFVVRYLRGDWSDDALIDEEVLGRARELGLSWNLDVYLGLACERHIKQGRFAEAAALIGRLRDLRDRGGYAFAASNIEANTAYLHLEQQEWQQAWEAALRFAATRDEITLRVIALSTRARAALGMGSAAAAAEALEGVARLVASSRRVPPYYLSAYWAAVLEAQTSEVLDARDLHSLPSPAKAGKAALRCVASVVRDRALVHRLLSTARLRVGDQRGAALHARSAWEAACRYAMAPEQKRLATLFAGPLSAVAPEAPEGGWPSAAKGEGSASAESSGSGA